MHNKVKDTETEVKSKLEKSKSVTSEESTSNSKTQRQSSTKGDKENGGKHVSLLVNETGISKSTLIMPVYVSHADNPSNELLVYVLLDTQSDTCFTSDNVLLQLGIAGKDTKLCLSTMTSEDEVICSRRVTGLTVRGHDSDIKIALPTVYSRNSIPSQKDCIPSSEVVNKWPYLRPVAGKLMPKSNCEVGLLIGYNCSKALLPREVIAPQDNGPFAMKTDLGWGIVGLLDTNTLQRV
jgi:hypothetical protein